MREQGSHARVVQFYYDFMLQRAYILCFFYDILLNFMAFLCSVKNELTMLKRYTVRKLCKFSITGIQTFHFAVSQQYNVNISQYQSQNTIYTQLISNKLISAISIRIASQSSKTQNQGSKSSFCTCHYSTIQ